MDITHKAQVKVLKQLLYQPQARFSDLNKTNLTNDQFTFHLKRLVSKGLVEKIGNLYRLTTKGLEIASRIDTNSLEVIKQPKLSVMVYTTRNNKNSKELLLSRRLTDPIINNVSFQTTKVKFGESLLKAAERCLKEETCLHGRCSFAGVIEYTHYKDKEILEAAVIICFKATNVEGELIEKSKKTQNFWVQLNEASKMPDTYPKFKQLLELFKREVPFYEEFSIHN